MNKKPIKLLPAFKDYLWGGEKLRTHYGKQTDISPLAESWELSTHKDGQSIVASGQYMGLSLSEYIEKIGKDALGKRAERFDYFPLLIKLIDAKKSLSVQVHPPMVMTVLKKLISSSVLVLTTWKHTHCLDVN